MAPQNGLVLYWSCFILETGRIVFCNCHDVICFLKQNKKWWKTPKSLLNAKGIFLQKQDNNCEFCLVYKSLVWLYTDLYGTFQMSVCLEMCKKAWPPVCSVWRFSRRSLVWAICIITNAKEHDLPPPLFCSLALILSSILIYAHYVILKTTP